MSGKRFFVVTLATIFVGLFGLLTLTAVGCESESEEPTTIPTVSPTETNAAEVESRQIKAWLLQELVKYRSLLDVVEGVQENLTELLGRRITQKQALDDVLQRKGELSGILASLEEVPPPASTKYRADLEEIHTSLVDAVEAHITALDYFADYIGYVPSEGGMPSNLDEASKWLEAATAKVNEASSLSGPAIERTEKLLREISD